MMKTGSLFDDPGPVRESREPLGAGAWVLRGFARNSAQALLEAVSAVAALAPFRHMETPGGFQMSVGMTNCGALGWLTDRRGYRYAAIDPDGGRRWPSMPDVFLDLAIRAAAEAGYRAFAPDACLINRYEPGARLSLHQDRNEQDFGSPIVSASLGLPATFQFGGARRSDRCARVLLQHGDVVVWGGLSRLNYHGVLPLKSGHHPLSGRARINLTFRRAASPTSTDNDSE